MIGIDVDPKILNIAKKKNKTQQGEFLLFDGEKIPFPDNHFDKVFACLVFCNLANKEEMLAEIYRVVKFGGSFHICDFGFEKNIIKRFLFNFFRRLTPLRKLLNDSDNEIYDLLASSKFKVIHQYKIIKIITGTLECYWANK